MKIDVQGFEGFVIKGGAEMLASKPPLFIFMEFSPSRQSLYKIDATQMFKDLLGYGYRIKNLDDGHEIKSDESIAALLRSEEPVWLRMKHTAALASYAEGDIKL